MAQYKMKLLSCFFEELKIGRKNIEIRCNDSKRKRLIVGDIILFSDLSTGETIETTVKNVEHADSFFNLISAHDLEDFGFNDLGIEEALNMLHQIYPVERENSLGVIGIHIEQKP